jgi:hypothetical protein
MVGEVKWEHVNSHIRSMKFHVSIVRCVHIPFDLQDIRISGTSRLVSAYK